MATPRFAACAGVAAAVLLIGAPGAAVAVADPGGKGGHSHRGDDNKRSQRGGDDDGGGHAERKPSSGDDGPPVTVGSGRSGTVDRSPRRSRSSDPDDAPGAGSKPPTARFGNGRTPRHVQRVDPPPPQSSGPAPAPVQPPAPPPVVITPPGPSWVGGLFSPSAVVQLEGAHSRFTAEPLFGLTGLVLLPAAGALLGYRQAKAAQAARRLDRR